MGLKNFLKDKLLFITLNVFTCLFSVFLLYMVNANLYFVLFIPCTYLVGCIIVIAVEFLIKHNYYKKLFSTLDGLTKKSLLFEVAPNPTFFESIILTQIFKETNKYVNDEIAKYKSNTVEYQEYIELWVHEIKTPIAGAKLICENMQNKAVDSELTRIENLVEQALFYCRSGNVENDFIVKKIELKDIINPLLRKNARRLIEQKISIETDNLNVMIVTDSKWLDFILGQILDNCVKYKTSNIKIYAKQNLNNVSLFIADNGIGIPNKDLSRVFNKGFTGENGRKYAKSTGIGLYLCKKLCNKMDIAISIKSDPTTGTCVKLIFPQSNMYT